MKPGSIVSEWGGDLRVADPDAPCPAISALGVNGRLMSRAGIVEGRDMPPMLYVIPHGWFPGKLSNLDNEPYPTIIGPGQYPYMIIEDGDMSQSPTSGKPPFRIPLLAEIRELPRNGRKVATTFAGGGGSSTGYEWAGYEVVWANEFVSAAGDTYHANHPSTILDRRDVRDVLARDILDATGLEPGELDIFDGSPPCDSFSTAGKRSALWSTVKQYSDERRQRTDDLFFEYTRLVAGLRPKVFVAENVSGMLKGTAKGYFKMVLAALRSLGYRVEARLLDAQWLGVPQARKRVIFIGVREDIGLGPVFPKPLPYRYTVRDALPWIGSMSSNSQFQATVIPSDQPTPTIYGEGPSTSGIVQEVTHTKYSGELSEVTDHPAKTLTAGSGGGEAYHWQAWIRAADGRQLDPETRHDLTIGKHTAVYKAWARHYSQRAGQPAACRKLTLRELRRLGGFPDDYALTGTYAQRWERIGQSVPPPMMFHIASTLRDEVFK